MGSIGSPPISPRAKFTLLIRTRLTSDFAFLLLFLGCWWLGPSTVITASPFGGWWLSNHRVFLLWPERRCPWANRGFWKVLPGWPRGAFHAMCSCFWAAPASQGRLAGGSHRAPAPSPLPLLLCVLSLCWSQRLLLVQPPPRSCGCIRGHWVAPRGPQCRGSRGGSKQSRPRAVRPGE